MLSTEKLQTHYILRGFHKSNFPLVFSDILAISINLPTFLNFRYTGCKLKLIYLGSVIHFFLVICLQAIVYYNLKYNLEYSITHYKLNI